ncbi:MAG: hypothetical protein K1Y02_23710 [Candidatus Hydrogenedentes bacterium]|nr:hypothetical protein [Candidatus Hydrogenedentota bacterium]
MFPTHLSRIDEISLVNIRRPHVVILGAGASRAAIPNGDANGVKVPVMADLIEILNLGSLLQGTALPNAGRSFEEIYSQISESPCLSHIQYELEARVYEYFCRLELPKNATIYDYLVLCLRDKDAIFSFNWDPLLLQAYSRNRNFGSRPRLYFLHGNVLLGSCCDGTLMGIKGQRCGKCGRQIEPTKLLYPVQEKDYGLTPLLENQWQELTEHLGEALLLTIFGYSAPKTDVKALQLIGDGWKSRKSQSLKEVEIIDIRPESEVIHSWNPLIYSDHYAVTSDFFDSSLAKHPRRTCEVHIAQVLDCQTAEGNPVPQMDNLASLQDWFAELLRAESDQRSRKHTD